MVPSYFGRRSLCIVQLLLFLTGSRAPAVWQKPLPNFLVKKDCELPLRIRWRLIISNLLPCSTLRFWVSYFIYYKFIPVFFEWIFLVVNKTKNRLISKRISNIHLSVTIEENWRPQNFDFLSLKNSSPGHFLGGASTHADIIEF